MQVREAQSHIATAPMRALRRVRPEYVIIAIFVGLKLYYALRSVFGSGLLGPRVIYGSDTEEYLSIAAAPLWSRDFFAGPDPLGFPLLMKLVLHNLRAVVLLQTTISVVSWTYLARTIQSFLASQAARTIVVIGILATALAPAVQQYDVAIGTESLSISLMVLLIALGLRLATSLTSRHVAAFLIVVAAAAFTRDTNAIFALGIGVGALVALVRSRDQWRRFGAIALVSLIAGAGALKLSADGNRSYWPLFETVALRINNDHDARTYFIEHGEPYDNVVKGLRTPAIYYLEQRAFTANTPPFRKFRAWIEDHGQATYAGFLLTHPGYVLSGPINERDALFRPHLDGIGKLFGIDPDPVTRAIGWVGLPDVTRWLGYWTAASVVGLLWVIRRARDRQQRFAMLVFALGVLVVPHALVVYHGDALEVSRHAITLAVHGRVVVWIATALTVDTALAAWGGFKTRRQH